MSGPEGVVARTVQASVVGGTVSVIGGGKFANGAYTAAFQHLLNNEMGLTRKQIVEQDKEALFLVADNTISGSEPIYALNAQSDVPQYLNIIKGVSIISGVDANLIASIMHVETTQGYYDKFIDQLDMNKSILPMNINVSYWGNKFGSRSQLLDPLENIIAGAKMIGAIQSRLPGGGTIRQIATLYNNINASQVSAYGARVGQVYNSNIWKMKDKQYSFK